MTRGAVPRSATRERAHHLREAGEWGGGDSSVELDDEPVTAGTRRRICCVRCREHITDSDLRIHVGEHSAERVVANPAGLMFEIVSVSEAWGVSRRGFSETDFSWYEGYQWTVISCDGCDVHLGWVFEAPKLEPASFYGLIVARLVEIDS